MSLDIKINNIDEMKEFAQKLARKMKDSPGIIFLDGDLGAGKTTFTKFFAKELGIEDVVTSPTFNIFKRYEFENSALNHFDLYRIQSDVYDQGFEEYWDNKNEITIIEWSIYLPGEFQEIASYKINITINSESSRIVNVEADQEGLAIFKEIL